MLKYIDYFNNIGSKNDTQKDLAILIYNSFKDYLEESIKEKFRDSKVDLAVIPGSLTSICQPLNVSINKPFKDNLHKE